MGENELELFLFYCWQLNIKTAEDLQKWKKEHNARTSAETLETLAKAYNGAEWEQINNI